MQKLAKIVPSVFLLVSIFMQLSSAQNGLSEADIQELVDVPNIFRSTTDPPASNMLRIVSCNWGVYAAVYTISLIDCFF